MNDTIDGEEKIRRAFDRAQPPPPDEPSSGNGADTSRPPPSPKELRARVEFLSAKAGQLSDQERGELIEAAALLRDMLTKKLRKAAADKLDLTLKGFDAAIKKRLEEISEAKAEAARKANKTAKRFVAGEYIVVNGRQLRDVAQDALAALENANMPPTLFVRGTSLARIVRDKKGRPLIEPLAEKSLCGMMTRAADFYATRKGRGGEEELVGVSPPSDLVGDVLTLGSWPFPSLEGITESPVLRPDGSVLDEPGYDVSTELYFVAAKGFTMPTVPESPTPQQVAVAVKFIEEELLADFPFVKNDDGISPSRANLLGLLITMVARPAIEGGTPMALLDKPSPGTGASLLAKVISIIATGRSAAMMTAPKSDEEWRKRITSTLIRGPLVVVIDNVTRPLVSDALDAMLTAETWEDRVLGRTKNVQLPNRAVWIATGNNLRVAGTLARRSYWIRLDAKLAQAWRRDVKSFRHAKLLAWVNENRGALLAALLTIVRGWYAAGRPEPKVELPALGGYEAWVAMVGGVLSNAGVDGFLSNLDELYEQIDDEGTDWEDFLAEWLTVFGDRPCSASAVADEITKEGSALAKVLPTQVAAALDRSPKTFAKALGSILKTKISTRFGAEMLSLERVDDPHVKRGLWRVVKGEWQRDL